MPCKNGSRSNGTAQTVTIDQYIDLNDAAKFYCLLAGVQPTITFQVSELCGNEPPDFQNIEPFDFVNLSSLNDKIRGNSKRKAWLSCCECIPDDPPNDPTPEPTPEPDDPSLPPLPDFDDYPRTRLTRLQFRGWTRSSNPITSYKRTVSYDCEDFPNLRAEYKGDLAAKTRTINVISDKGFVTIYPESAFDQYIYDYKITLGVVPDDPPRNDPPPDFPEPPEFVCKFNPDSFNFSELLKKPDKAEIISILQLYISESNNRVISEISSNTSQAVNNSLETLLARLTEDFEFYDAKTRDRIKIIDDNANGRKLELINEIRLRQITTINYITEVRDNINQSILTATGVIGAGIAASTVTVTTAIATSTATVTAAIATATTTVTTAIATATNQIVGTINAVKSDLISKIEQTKKDINDEIELYAPRYRTLKIEVTSDLRGEPCTFGLRGSQDKYALGWIQFQKDGYSFDRQFIINKKQVFVCQQPNLDVNYTIQALPKFQITATIGWTDKKEVK